VKRRDLVALARAAAMILAGVLAADPFVIGFMGLGSAREYAPFVSTFRRALADNGYAEGQKLTIEYRWADGRYEKLPELAADLVTQKVDLIVAGGGNASALAAKNATQNHSHRIRYRWRPRWQGYCQQLSPSRRKRDGNKLAHS